MPSVSRIVETTAELRGDAIATAMTSAEIIERVMDRGELLLLKGAFPEDMLVSLRQAVADWGRDTALAEVDDFRANYHRRRAMVSRLQQAPHVFHDYNFNDLAAAPRELRRKLEGVFEPLRRLYNQLTGYGVTFDLPAAGPYVHPQLIHYPSGGGFFARHWHNLLPQKLGFIVSLARRGRDYRNGGTGFAIEGEIVELEGLHDIGDILVWRYDHPHWVTQSDLADKFDWTSDAGRWVATFAYFDPKG